VQFSRVVFGGFICNNRGTTNCYISLLTHPLFVDASCNCSVGGYFQIFHVASAVFSPTSTHPKAGKSIFVLWFLTSEGPTVRVNVSWVSHSWLAPNLRPPPSFLYPDGTHAPRQVFSQARLSSPAPPPLPPLRLVGGTDTSGVPISPNQDFLRLSFLPAFLGAPLSRSFSKCFLRQQGPKSSYSLAIYAI